MLKWIGVNLACFFLKRGNLSIDDANRFGEIILSNLQAIPIRDIIKVDENFQLSIKGKPLNLEEAKRLRQGAVSALENQTLRFVREQVAFAAVTNGLHKAEAPAQIFFARAALWFSQQEVETLEALAQRTSEPPVED